MKRQAWPLIVLLLAAVACGSPEEDPEVPVEGQTPDSSTAEDGEIAGMALPADAVEKIYAGNFERMAPAAGKPLDKQAAAQ